MSDNLLHRQTFDQVASLYNEARPRYPEELFSRLIDITALEKDATLLEIGPGTGQATKPLAQKGFKITAVELGNSLAEIARNELRDYKNVEILNGFFEEVKLAPRSFDMVYAATSFHWIDPSVKFLKTHDCLKDNGYLTIIHTNHISDTDGDKFFTESQVIYDRYGYTDKHRTPVLPGKDELKPDHVDEHLFKIIHFEHFPIVITYTAKNFVKLLNTFSNHLATDSKVRQAFYLDIENLINEKFSGRIDKHFSMSLTIAEKIRLKT